MIPIKTILKDWPTLLTQVSEPYMVEIGKRLAACDKATLCPPMDDILNAYALSPSEVKVVILGLDPYINGEACGFW